MILLPVVLAVEIRVRDGSLFFLVDVYIVPVDNYNDGSGVSGHCQQSAVGKL